MKNDTEIKHGFYFFLMNENFQHNDRKEILRLITIGICLLELIIATCTFFYQQDTQSRTEIPISDEMARIYIDHPEKLKENERLAVNLNSTSQKGYLLITDTVIHHAFPWKGWILLSIGTPITLAFLIVLVAKAYCQVADIERQSQEFDDVENKWIHGFNTLNKINLSWLMLVLICLVFVFWYLPEFVKSAGNITADWLARLWWIPVMLCTLLFLLVALWFYLQYRLRLKAMQMNMEIEKIKLLHMNNEKSVSMIEHNGSDSDNDAENG